jgi:hypothetical protein
MVYLQATGQAKKIENKNLVSVSGHTRVLPGNVISYTVQYILYLNLLKVFGPFRS